MHSKPSIPLLLLVLALASPATWAQSVRDSTFSIRTSLAAGYAYYLADVPIATSTERGGLSVSARIMWHPDHLLRIGLESGYTSFYSYHIGKVSTQFGETSADLRLSAIPLLLVFSMPVWRDVEIHAGSGWMWINSRSRSFDNFVDVRQFSQGWMMAASWAFPISTKTNVGTELKWMAATEYEDAVITLQLRLAMDVYEW